MKNHYLQPMAFLVFSLAIVCFAFTNLAIVSAAGTPHPAVCRVVVEEQMGQAFGSGTLIDAREDYGLVVTNWHVVRDATGTIEVQFPGGFRSEARPVKLDETWDLAALVVWRPPTEPVRLANQAPKVGDLLTIHGYGQGDYRQAWGRCTDYYSPTQGMPQELVELNVEARQGDSGGPIFNARGEMAGVLFGAGQGTTLGSFGGRVDQFLATLGEGIGKGSLAPQTPHAKTLLANGQQMPIVNQFAQSHATIAKRYESSNISVRNSSAAKKDPFLHADLRAEQSNALASTASQVPDWLPSKPNLRREPNARGELNPNNLSRQPRPSEERSTAQVATLPGPTKQTAVHTVGVPDLSLANGSWGPTPSQTAGNALSSNRALPTGKALPTANALTMAQVPKPVGIDLHEEGRTILALVGLIALAIQGVRATAGS